MLARNEKYVIGTYRLPRVSRAMRQFVAIDLSAEPVPDETTICELRHLMETRNLNGELFQLINIYVEENGLKVNRGAIVDAAII